MSATDSNRSSLEGRLARLLGIGDDDRDYAVDVLDSLLDIGDPDDVAEYLAGFVAGGDDDGGEALLQFAHDLEKFKKGEDIASSADGKDDDVIEAATNEEKPKPRVLDEAAAQREEIRRREVAAREKQRQELDRLAREKDEEEQRRREEEAAAVAAAAKKKHAEASLGKKAGADRKAVRSQPSSQKLASGDKKNQSREVKASAKKTEQKVPKASNQQHKPAEKGQPKKKPCGCYGNKHKPLTNCLRCGRISCEREGVDDFCHFCGFYIQGFATNVDGANMTPALRHKERLLQFDRESARRTHIHDDQEDYFAASTSMWATREEQEDARQKEENRQKKIHERQQQVLNINF